jgi:hypothetical protein
VGDRAHDVVAIKALIEGDGGGEACDEGVDGFTEAAAPGLIGLVGAHGFARCSADDCTDDGLNEEVVRPILKGAGDDNSIAGFLFPTACRTGYERRDWNHAKRAQ